METLEHENLVIEIDAEKYPLNPREEFDHFGTFVCFHRRYKLGDKHTFTLEEAKELETSGVIFLPLYLYDHSGLTIATRPFSCPWDSGRIGLVYATPEAIEKEFGSPSTKPLTTSEISRIKEMLASEVAEYDQYLRGDVWSYIIKDKDGTILDSCGQIYGHDYTVSEAKASASYFSKSFKENPTYQI